MSNQIRARNIWLNDETVSSLDLYADYKDVHFAPHRFFGADRLLRLADGSPIVVITTDEEEGAFIEPWSAAPNWNYRVAKADNFHEGAGFDIS